MIRNDHLFISMQEGTDKALRTNVNEGTEGKGRSKRSLSLMVSETLTHSPWTTHVDYLKMDCAAEV